VLYGSGFFLRQSNVLGEGVYQQQIQSIFELSNAVEGLSPACIADNPGAEWRCQFAPTAFAHVRAPVFVIDSSIDSWQVRYLDPTNQRPGC
jgi:hypothetical protein